MTDKSIPLWRCKACDWKFEKPATWPGDSAHDRKVLEDPEGAIEERLVCPRCHSMKIERWR